MLTRSEQKQKFKKKVRNFTKYVKKFFFQTKYYGKKEKFWLFEFKKFFFLLYCETELDNFRSTSLKISKKWLRVQKSPFGAKLFCQKILNLSV